MPESSIRIENILLLAPFIFLFLLTSLMPNQYIAIIFFETTLWLSPVEATLVCLILVAIPYLMHYALRHTQKGNIILLDLHVAFSFLLICLLPIAYYQVPLISKRWLKDLSTVPVYEKWVDTMRMVTFFWISYITLQVLFLLYTIIMFSRKNTDDNM